MRLGQTGKAPQPPAVTSHIRIDNNIIRNSGHVWPDAVGVMEEVLKATGVMKVGRVGRATTRFLRVRDFRQFLATIFNDAPYCLVLRPPDRASNNLLLDALQKASAMLRAWSRGPQSELIPVRWPKETQGVVREDCPAFAGYGALSKPPGAAEIPRKCSHGKTEIPLCKANNRHRNCSDKAIYSTDTVLPSAADALGTGRFRSESQLSLASDPVWSRNCADAQVSLIMGLKH